MASTCLECSARPQTGQFGLCDECRRERRERVRASIRDGERDGDQGTSAAIEADDQPVGQASLTDWGGSD